MWTAGRTLQLPLFHVAILVLGEQGVVLLGQGVDELRAGAIDQRVRTECGAHATKSRVVKLVREIVEKDYFVPRRDHKCSTAHWNHHVDLVVKTGTAELEIEPRLGTTVHNESVRLDYAIEAVAQISLLLAGHGL